MYKATLIVTLSLGLSHCVQPRVSNESSSTQEQLSPEFRAFLDTVKIYDVSAFAPSDSTSLSLTANPFTRLAVRSEKAAQIRTSQADRYSSAQAQIKGMDPKERHAAVIRMLEGHLSSEDVIPHIDIATLRQTFREIGTIHQTYLLEGKSGAFIGEYQGHTALISEHPNGSLAVQRLVNFNPEKDILVEIGGVKRVLQAEDIDFAIMTRVEALQHENSGLLRTLIIDQHRANINAFLNTLSPFDFSDSQREPFIKEAARIQPNPENLTLELWGFDQSILNAAAQNGLYKIVDSQMSRFHRAPDATALMIAANKGDTDMTAYVLQRLDGHAGALGSLLERASVLVEPTNPAVVDMIFLASLQQATATNADYIRARYENRIADAQNLAREWSQRRSSLGQAMMQWSVSDGPIVRLIANASVNHALLSTLLWVATGNSDRALAEAIFKDPRFDTKQIDRDLETRGRQNFGDAKWDAIKAGRSLESASVAPAPKRSFSGRWFDSEF